MGRLSRKLTVEESLSLAMWDFRKRLYPHAAGTFTWSWGDESRASVGYLVDWDTAEPTIMLHYHLRGGEAVRIPVRLQSTPTQFGGQRWWFTCPLIVDEAVCNRRVGKLYLPPGAKYFGCRTCHGLTYRSCQKAHQAERFFGSTGHGKYWLDGARYRQRTA